MSASLEASLKLDIAQYQAQLAKARGEAKKFRDQLQSSGGFGKAFAGSGSMIAGLAGTAGLGLLVRRGLEFNQTIGDSEIAISQVLRQFKGLSSEAAKQEAAKAMQAMVDLEPQTAASLTGLVDGFLATLGSSQAVGIDVAQNIDLVGKFANALANAKIPAEQLSQEMRSILTGNIGADSTLAKTLNISNADIEKAREAGKLYEFLVGKIGLLGEAGDSAGVAFSRLSSAMDKAAGALTEGLFGQGVQGAKDLATVLEENKQLFMDIGTGIAFATKEIVGFLAEANKLRDSLTQGVGEGIGKMLGFGGVAANSVSATNKEAQDQGAAADAAAKFGPAKQFDAAGNVITPKPVAKTEASGSSATASEPDAKARIEAQREINQLLAAEAALAEKRMADYLSILPPNLQLIEIKREMIRLEQERDALTGPGFDEKRLEIENDLLNLRKQSRDAERDLADEKERAAEQQKADAEKAGQQGDALASFQAEMDLINAKIAGNKELVAELQKQADIQQIQQDLMAQAGLSEQDALTKAQQMVEAKKKLNDIVQPQSSQEKPRYDAEGRREDGRKQIKGYSQNQGGADEARVRAGDRVNAARERVQGQYDKFFGTSAFDRAGPTKGQEGAVNPLGPQAHANANKEAASGQPAANPQQQVAQQIVTLVSQILSAVQ